MDNLNEQDADVIFIKNIDNVTVSNLGKDVGSYKEMLAGVLLKLQDQTFDYLKKLDSEKPHSETMCTPGYGIVFGNATVNDVCVKCGAGKFQSSTAPKAKCVVRHSRLLTSITSWHAMRS